MEKKLLNEAPVSMALMDAVPVVCFGISSYCLCTVFKPVLFKIGALLAIVGGLSKVIYKLLLAITKKSYPILVKYAFKQLILGLVIMFVAVLLNLKLVNIPVIISKVCSFPINLLLIGGVGMMIALSIVSKKMDASSLKSNWIEQTINSIGQLLFTLAVIIGVYF